MALWVRVFALSRRPLRPDPPASNSAALLRRFTGFSQLPGAILVNRYSYPGGSHEGAATLRQRILRKVELVSEKGLHLSRAIDHLRSGTAVVTIRRVGSNDAPRVRQALETVGVGTHHYFGTRTFDWCRQRVRSR